jgi:hypothetical protein
MSAPPRVDADSGFAIDTGHGPKPATVDEVNLMLARIAVLRPNKVKPADDDAHRLVRDVLQRRTPIVHVPPRREREPKPRARSRRRAGSSRDGPDDPPDDPDLDPPPIALLRGFTEASERLSRHLQRRAASRYVA